jgi:hypothetical protein
MIWFHAATQIMVINANCKQDNDHKYSNFNMLPLLMKQ